MNKETSITKRVTPIWLVITRIPMAFEPDVIGNYLVKAINEAEAYQAVKEQHTPNVQIDYVTSSLENPALIRGMQMEKCTNQLDVDSDILETFYEFYDIDISV